MSEYGSDRDGAEDERVRFRTLERRWLYLYIRRLHNIYAPHFPRSLYAENSGTVYNIIYTAIYRAR